METSYSVRPSAFAASTALKINSVLCAAVATPLFATEMYKVDRVQQRVLYLARSLPQALSVFEVEFSSVRKEADLAVLGFLFGLI